jgi:phenylpyruvate tautomerase PptA (4-oxalocrotonate tautomerase family)
MRLPSSGLKDVSVRIEEQEPNHWMLGGATATAELIAKKFGTIEWQA